jgi:hypothetical protein
MEEALRYNQHLQFCKQLQVLQRQLCEETQLSSELLSSLYALGKYHQTPASCLTQLAAAFPEVRSCFLLEHHCILRCTMANAQQRRSYCLKKAAG